MRKLIIIRADGNQSIGMGHLKREIDITRELEALNCEIIFIVKDHPEAILFLKRNNINFIKISKESNEKDSSLNKIKELYDLKKKKNDLIIIDLLENFYNQDFINDIRNYCKKIVILTDITNPIYFNHVDSIFAFSPNQSAENYRDIKNTQYFIGLKYVALSPIFQNIKRKEIKKEINNILLTFGGSDPQNYSTKLFHIFKELNLNVNITLILGPGFPKQLSDQLLDDLPKKFTIMRNIKDMAQFYNDADIAICSAGNTLIELLTFGVPSLVLPQTKRENEHANAIEGKNMLYNIGLDFDNGDLINEIKSLINNYNKRKTYSHNAQNFFDGKGINRIIKIIRNLL